MRISTSIQNIDRFSVSYLGRHLGAVELTFGSGDGKHELTVFTNDGDALERILAQMIGELAAALADCRTQAAKAGTA